MTSFTTITGRFLSVSVLLSGLTDITAQIAQETRADIRKGRGGHGRYGMLGQIKRKGGVDNKLDCDARHHLSDKGQGRDGQRKSRRRDSNNVEGGAYQSSSRPSGHKQKTSEFSQATARLHRPGDCKWHLKPTITPCVTAQLPTELYHGPTTGSPPLE